MYSKLLFVFLLMTNLAWGDSPFLGANKVISVEQGEVAIIPINITAQSKVKVRTTPYRKTYITNERDSSGKLIASSLILSTGVNIPSITVEVTVFFVDFEKQNFDILEDTMQIVVPGVGPNPPNPNPTPNPNPQPNPQPNVIPEGYGGFTKATYAAAGTIPADVFARTGAKYATAVYNVDMAAQAAIAAGTNPSVQQFVTMLQTSTDAALGADAASWKTFRDTLDPKWSAHFASNPLNLASYCNVLTAMYDGLKLKVEGK